jgi:hypothetical protein
MVSYGPSKTTPEQLPLEQYLDSSATDNCSCAVTDGFGLTVTVIVKAAPVHVPVVKKELLYIPPFQQLHYLVC